MAAELVITTEARQDLAEAYGWYESQKTGLGEEFLSCLEACFEKIRRTPMLYSKFFENYRRALPRRFPYAVFYEYSAEKVTVFAVFHTSRDPAKWIMRLA